MKKILKAALFSSAIIAPMTVGLTTVSCGTTPSGKAYKTNTELQIIFNQKNLTTPITNAITQKFVTKDLTTPLISNLIFKTSSISDVKSYQPKATISGSFTYTTSTKKDIMNLFSLIISYDEKNTIYKSSFMNVDTIAPTYNPATINSAMTPSKWDDAVMTKMNQGKTNDFKVSQVKLTDIASYNITKNDKGDFITTAYYKGTWVKFGKQQIISVEVLYNNTEAKGKVTQAFMPFVIDQGNTYVSGSGTHLFNLLFPALKTLIKSNWTGSYCVDVNAFDHKTLTINIANQNSFTSTKVIVSGDVATKSDDANSRKKMPTHFTANLSYDFRTLSYTLDQNKDIKITPNDRMLLGHDQVAPAVKVCFDKTSDTLKSFQVQSFVAKTKDQGAYSSVVGWLTTKENIKKIFYMNVTLKGQKPIAETYNSVSTDTPFKDLSVNGKLYQEVLPSVSNIKNFDKLTITKADKSTFTSKYYPYNSKTTIYLSITLKDKTVTKYTESVLYEFDWKHWDVGYPTIVK